VNRAPLRRILLLVALAALLAPVAASASLRLRHVDANGFPTIRATVVTPVASAQPPTATENGERVVGLEAVNLASSKSVVIAIDRSRSMAGRQLRDATAAAREFLAAKSSSDRVAVVVFGSRPVQLTRFSSSHIDADGALRVVGVDPRRGTTLNDALLLSTRMLAKEQGRVRVVVLLTDGSDTSSETSLPDALAAARKDGVHV